MANALKLIFCKNFVAMERKMVRCTMIIFDGNENRQLAVRIVNVGKIDDSDDNDDDDGDNDDNDAAIGNNVCMQCILDKCVNAQRAIRCTYERNV